MTNAAHQTARQSDLARARLLANEKGPALINDWMSAVFIHLEVDRDRLQRVVPFELDLYDGRAFVSIVAFTMRRLRFARGGRMVEWLAAPVAHHGFCNVRTYVRHENESAIYFLGEWLPNVLSIHLGPRLFGLPYRFGRLDYQHDEQHGQLTGVVRPGDAQGVLRYAGRFSPPWVTAPCDEPSLDAFLVERYTCFTMRRGVARRFRIWHEPWPITPIDIDLSDRSLLHCTGDWSRTARVVSGHFSPGVTDVWIGRPTCVNGPACSRPWLARTSETTAAMRHQPEGGTR